MIQKWHCQKCGIEGETEMPDRIDVHSAIALLAEDHDVLSPDCHEQNGASGLRAVVEQNS